MEKIEESFAARGLRRCFIDGEQVVFIDRGGVLVGMINGSFFLHYECFDASSPAISLSSC